MRWSGGKENTGQDVRHDPRERNQIVPDNWGFNCYCEEGRREDYKQTSRSLAAGNQLLPRLFIDFGWRVDSSFLVALGFVRVFRATTVVQAL